MLAGAQIAHGVTDEVVGLLGGEPAGPLPVVGTLQRQPLELSGRGAPRYLLADVQTRLQQRRVAAGHGMDAVPVHVVEEAGRVGLCRAGPDDRGEKRATEQS